MSDVLWIEDADELRDLIDSAQEVVLEFTAPSWCQPCKRFAPHFDAAAVKSDATFIAVDVDKVPEAAVEYGVKGVPTVMFYRNGDYVKNLQERSSIKLLNEINSA